jgi:hypothetical protein
MLAKLWRGMMVPSASAPKMMVSGSLVRRDSLVALLMEGAHAEE